ncbi:hypothetical protein VTK26DRAFT_3311 [Humicola hyalothermophila]
MRTRSKAIVDFDDTRRSDLWFLPEVTYLLAFLPTHMLFGVVCTSIADRHPFGRPCLRSNVCVGLPRKAHASRAAWRWEQIVIPRPRGQARRPRGSDPCPIFPAEVLLPRKAPAIKYTTSSTRSRPSTKSRCDLSSPERCSPGPTTLQFGRQWSRCWGFGAVPNQV